MRKFVVNRMVIAGVAILTGLLIVAYFGAQRGRQSARQSLTDIENITTLRTQFNLDAGKTRLILLVSPT